jgi:hypothetical protein
MDDGDTGAFRARASLHFFLLDQVANEVDQFVFVI